MQIKINTQHLTLIPEQEARILKKMEHLTHLGARLADEASEIKVDLSFESSRRPNDAYACHVTFFVPRNVLRAESHSDTLDNAVDEVVDKLKTQIERYKAKLIHDEKRKT